MNGKRQLRVGDRLYKVKYGAIVNTCTIDRITPTMAKAGTLKFRIEIDPDGGANQIGRDTWDSGYYRLENEELRGLVKRQAALQRVRAFTNYARLTTEQIQRILAVIDEPLKKGGQYEDEK